jgi:hypothetical protein
LSEPIATEALYINRAVRRRLGRVGTGILYQLEHRRRGFSPDDLSVFTRNAERKPARAQRAITLGAARVAPRLQRIFLP